MSNPSTPSNSTDDRNFDAEVEYTFGVRRPADMVDEVPSARTLTDCELRSGQDVSLNVLAAETGLISEAYRLARTSGRSAHHKGKEIKDRQAPEMLLAQADRALVETTLPRL